jgi:hypothetical protein
VATTAAPVSGCQRLLILEAPRASKRFAAIAFA